MVNKIAISASCLGSVTNWPFKNFNLIEYLNYK